MHFFSRAVCGLSAGKEKELFHCFCLVNRKLNIAGVSAFGGRAFSTIKIIKNKLLSKINNEWFNGLMICYTEWESFKPVGDKDII